MTVKSAIVAEMPARLISQAVHQKERIVKKRKKKKERCAPSVKDTIAPTPTPLNSLRSWPSNVSRVLKEARRLAHSFISRNAALVEARHNFVEVEFPRLLGPVDDAADNLDGEHDDGVWRRARLAK